MVQRTMSASTHGGYKTYWDRYLKPRVGKYALRDFTVAVVSGLLEDIANNHTLNTDTVGKVRSLLSGVFTYAMGKGDFPGKAASENPASCALIPESATEPKDTVAASREEVKATLAALKEMPLERAAVALVAFTGVRPSEARGLRWEEWNREQQHIAVQRGVWLRIVGDTKTLQSVRCVTVSVELREILLDLESARFAARWIHPSRPQRTADHSRQREQAQYSPVAQRGRYRLARFLFSSPVSRDPGTNGIKKQRDRGEGAGQHKGRLRQALHQAGDSSARCAKSGE
jgi:integrase